MPIAVTSVCLDEARALAFVSGQLPVAARQTIEDHIDDCGACRQVLAVMVRRTRPADPDAGAGGWRAGTRVGRYVVGARIGHGGMGAVWRATDVELGREVALKRLHADAGGGDEREARARLVREARVAAQLDHPNVVGVYEVGEDAGVPFLAMELVDGETLMAWARGRDVADIVAMLAQAGRGLAAAHARGLVHRDFKPDNVLVDRSGRARVADFGLARAEAAPVLAAVMGDGALARMTVTGAVAGTPAYLAPELAEGALPDARSDQYAFGIAAYEALHGQHPFAGTTAVAMWIEMAAGRVRAGTRPVPAWLERCVRRALAPRPEDRWTSVEEMVEVMERGGAAVGARRGRGKSRAGVAAVAAVAAVVAVVIVVVVVAQREPEPQPQRVAQPEPQREPEPQPQPQPQPGSGSGSGPVPVSVTAPVTAPVSAPAPARKPKRTKKDLFDAAFDASADGDPKRALALAEEAVALDPGDEESRRIATYWACFNHNEAKALKHAAHLSHHEWSLVAGGCSRSDIMLPEPAE